VPIIVSMIIVLMQVESAISTSIVNQRYARSTLHFLMLSSRYYLELGFLKNLNTGLYMRRFWVGVDDNIDYQNKNVHPKAPIRAIGRMPGDDTAQTEFSYNGGGITTRQNVRIRSTAFVCLPPFSLSGDQLMTEGNMSEETFTGGYQFCAD